MSHQFKGQVYKITNKLTGKFYIGATTGSLQERLKQHSWANTRVGRALRKDGLANFRIESLAEFNNKQSMNQGELEMIRKHKGPKSYNYKPVNLEDTELKILAESRLKVAGVEVDVNQEFVKLYKRSGSSQRSSILRFLHSMRTPFVLLKNIATRQIVIDV